jgi:hypothetical protein
MKRTLIRLHVIVRGDRNGEPSKTVHSEDALPENVNAAVARLQKQYPQALKIKQQTVPVGAI